MSPLPQTLTGGDQVRLREPARSVKPQRLPAIDFTKGVLVMVMVLYHWMNYFLSVDGNVYKYLRFLTPSFIFITGFLIAHVYLPADRASRPNVPRRLVVRGLKLLAISLVLNLMSSMAGLASRRVNGLHLTDLLYALATGAAAVSFSVLVPIAYLLIASAGLFAVSRRFLPAFHVASAICACTALLGELAGIRTGYLQIFSIGMLGISAGYLQIEGLDALVARRWLLAAGMMAYFGAIAVWDDMYVLQILGVVTMLAVIYALGPHGSGIGSTARTMVQVGQYSLFAYIFQILMLQLLRRPIRYLRPDDLGRTVVALLACSAATIAAVASIDMARKKGGMINRLYNIVFA